MLPELASLPLYEILARLGVAAALGFVAALFHTFLARGTDSSRFFFSAQVLLAVLVATMMVAIDERLPRALGLFASLSIVRFRMPVKSLREIVFIFLAIAIGISAGSGAFRVALLGSSMGLLILLFISVFKDNRFFGSTRRLLEVTFRPQPGSTDPVPALEEKLTAWCKRFIPSESRNIDGLSSKIYEIWIDKKARDAELIDDLKTSMPNIQTVRIVRLFNSNDAIF